MIELSKEQLIDAVGAFSETANSVVDADQARFDVARVPSPHYEEVAYAFDIEPQQTTFAVPNDSESRHKLAGYAGMRVMVGVQVPSAEGTTRTTYFPGIVLQGQIPSIGILTAGQDAVTSQDDLRRHIQRPLSDFQHNLLEKMYAFEKPTAAEHTPGGQANVAETAHGALIAVTNPLEIAGLHGRVHSFVDAGFTRSLSKTKPGAISATDLNVNGRLRKDSGTVVPALSVGTIVISKEHQLEKGQETFALGAGQLAVGMTLAAVRSKVKDFNFPQPDLAAGMAVMTSPTNYVD